MARKEKTHLLKPNCIPPRDPSFVPLHFSLLVWSKGRDGAHAKPLPLPSFVLDGIISTVSIRLVVSLRSSYASRRSEGKSTVPSPSFPLNFGDFSRRPLRNSRIWSGFRRVSRRARAFQPYPIRREIVSPPRRSSKEGGPIPALLCSRPCGTGGSRGSFFLCSSRQRWTFEWKEIERWNLHGRTRF